MTLDLSLPEHREALRWACEFIRTSGSNFADGIVAELGTCALFRSDFATALRALSDPARAAEVLRGLLVEAKADENIKTGPTNADGFRGALAGDRVYVQLFRTRWVFDMARLPQLVLSLLDIPTDAPDARERALAVLREAGR